MWREGGCGGTGTSSHTLGNVGDPFPAIPVAGGGGVTAGRTWGSPSLPRGGGWFLGTHRCLWRWLLDTHLSRHCLEIPVAPD